MKKVMFHKVNSGRVLVTDDSEPALGARGWEFESLHPDTRDTIHLCQETLSNDGASFLPYLIIYNQL